MGTAIFTMNLIIIDFPPPPPPINPPVIINPPLPDTFTYVPDSTFTEPVKPIDIPIVQDGGTPSDDSGKDDNTNLF